MWERSVQSGFDGLVLGIETSCDETSVALVEGTAIRANVISSQVELHRKWGGVVPEAAARAHVEAFLPVLSEALAQGSAKLGDVRAIAVTNRPGLVGALSVGVTAGKALSYSRDVPFVGVHHLEAHLLSPFMENAHLELPCLCLLVSGGHTELVRIDAPGRYQVLGETRDDAAGEAFDKGARLLGLGYPGGQAIQAEAQRGKAGRYPLPRAQLGNSFDFSFSGLKTAVMRLVEQEGEKLSIPDAAASLQAAIVDVLVEKTLRAAESQAVASMTVAGGVAANEELRCRLKAGAERAGIAFGSPSIELCTDNAAMIAFAGGFQLKAGPGDSLDLDVFSTAPLPGSAS